MGSGITRNQALAGVAVLVAVLVLVIVAASSGGGGGAKTATTTTATVRPAASGAPANQQIDRLEQIVRQARR